MEERVLLLAPRGRDAQVIAQVLEPHGFHSVAVDSVQALADALHAGAGMAFVTEEALVGVPQGELVDWLERQPPWSDFHFVVLATRRTGSRPAAALDALRALGNVVIQERPLNGETLLSAARSGLRARTRQYQMRAHLAEQARISAEAKRLYKAEVEARQQVIEAREMLALAVEAAGVGTFHCPLPHGVIQWNQTARDQFFLSDGASPDLDAFYACLHADDQPRVRQAVSRVLQEGTLYDVEYRTVSSTGRERWIRAKGRAYEDASGALVRFDGVTIDISDQKALEREREALLEAERNARIHAETASRMKDEFLANLSHELRTPLGAIFGWTHVLLKGQLMPDQQRAVETISRNARAQAKLIDDLLDMSRIVSGNIRLELEPVRLGAVVDAAVASLQPSSSARGVTVRTDFGGVDDSVNGDPHRLQQVVWNLLSNAIKFTPMEGTVTVRLATHGQHHELSVSDSGAGIPDEFLPYVFDRFRQADASSTRGHGGLGLGLAIVKTLVDLHGGSVAAHSAGVGRGATFTVRLPRAAVAATQTTVGGAKDAAAAARSLQGLRVLVVDDERDLRELMQKVLGDCGADVRAVGSAAEALASIERSPPELLISDIAMPLMDGYELIRRVRLLDSQRGRALPAIALTAFASADDRARALGAGFVVHVAKPVEPAQLILTVASASGRHAA